MNRATRYVAVLLLAFAVTGCASRLSPPMPDVSGRLALKVAPARLSKMSELPLGVHQIDEMPVYVSGHQGSGSLVDGVNIFDRKSVHFRDMPK